MKSKILLQLIFIVTFYSCNGDSNNDIDTNLNLAPSSFEISVNQITDRSATITWTPSLDPEKGNITYQIFLNNEPLENKTNSLIYNFIDLLSETNYTGKIIASDGIYNTTVDFSFKTQSFIPLIYNGNVSLTNQQEVINFGKKKYNIINGKLDIYSLSSSASNITDLSPLLDLMEVQGDVEIKLSSLSNLEGLNNLTKINNSLNIYYNQSLISLKGLDEIISISKNLKIYNNNLLENINTLNKVSNISGDINISHNPKLLIINILKEVSSINNIAIYSNESLESIQGFEKVNEIKYNLDINNNKVLNSISGFNDLTNIGVGLYISDSNINNLQFSKLNTVGGPIELINNKSLQNLSGFSNLTTVDGSYFYIWNNNSLFNFCDIISLVKNGGIKGAFSISGNLYNPTANDLKNDNCKP